MKDKFYELVVEAGGMVGGMVQGSDSGGGMVQGSDSGGGMVGGSILIDGDPYNVAFDTCIDNVLDTGNNNSIKLIIHDEDKFFDLMSEYLEEEIRLNRKKFYFNDKSDIIKFYMFQLLVNATTSDFNNPNELLRRNISFRRDDTFKYLNDGVSIRLGDVFYNSLLTIKNELTDSRMETPYKISLSLNNSDGTYNLPSIYYGIDNDTAYIYSIMNDNSRNNTDSLPKKINRVLYKINDKVRDDDLKDITPSFVLSLDIFIKLLENSNIYNIKGVPYLPLRYMSRDISARKKNSRELEERNDLIQKNLTDKFIRTFRRVERQDNLYITSYPYDVDDFLSAKILPNKDISDNILLREIDSNVRRR